MPNQCLAIGQNCISKRSTYHHYWKPRRENVGDPATSEHLQVAYERSGELTLQDPSQEQLNPESGNEPVLFAHEPTYLVLIRSASSSSLTLCKSFRFANFFKQPYLHQHRLSAFFFPSAPTEASATACPPNHYIRPLSISKNEVFSNRNSTRILDCSPVVSSGYPMARSSGFSKC